MSDETKPGAPPMSAEQAIGMPTPEQAGKRRERPSRAKVKAAAPEDGKPRLRSGLSGERVDITLHDSDRIPPGGQFLAINGVQFMLKPSLRASVPIELLEILDNCIQTEPILDDKLSVVGYRNVPRLTYHLHRE